MSESAGKASTAGATTPARGWFGRTIPGSLFSEGQFFFFLSILIGLFGGLSVVCFQLAIDSTRFLLLTSSLRPPAMRVLLAPTLAGLVVAVLVQRFFRRVRGSGVNQTKAAVFIFDGYIPFNTVIGKFLTCALGIGAGHSLGPEDPSLQIGAGIASALGRRMELSREKLRLIAPVGAAAGLAAAFNAPISAVLFVIEEVIGNWSAGVLGAVVVSAVASVTVERWFRGDEPLFHIPSAHFRSVSDLPAYILLGIVGGYFSIFFLKLVLTVRPRLKRLPRWTQYVQPAGAGLLIGIIGLGFPQVMGAGYGYMDQAMHDQFTWKLLLLLAMLKLAATSLSFVSGTPGGLFAPTLFMGAMLGGAVGGFQQHFFPVLHVASVGPYALVGMGVLFAGILRAPMTSIFMIVELTGDYSAIVPVMIANAIAYLISRRNQKVALFDELSRQDGMNLPSMEERREETPLRAEDAMRRFAAPVLSARDTVREARDAVHGTHEGTLLVRGDFGWGSLPAAALQSAGAKLGDDARISSLCAQVGLPTLHPDEPLEIALRLLEDRPLLPVVRRSDHDILQGVLGLQEILEAYRRREEESED